MVAMWPPWLTSIVTLDSGKYCIMDEWSTISPQKKKSQILDDFDIDE